MSLWYGLSGSIQNSSMPRGQWNAPGIMPSRSSSRTSRRSTKTTSSRPCRRLASSRLIVVIRAFASSTSWRNPFFSFIAGSSRRRRPSLGGERRPAVAVIVRERGVGLDNRLDLVRDAREVAAPHGDVELIIAGAGVHPVADAAGARDGAAGERRWQRH